jgi:hypothetical protein
MAESRFSTDQQNQFRTKAKAAGADDAWMDDFLQRNPDDYNRLEESWQPTNHRPFDSQSTSPFEQDANRKADISSGSPLANAWGGSSGGNSAMNQWMGQSPVGGSGMGGGIAGGARGGSLWDMLMSRATQSTNVDRNDPAVRMQADAYSANEERARRNYVSDMAEELGPYETGALRGENRMATERMGQRVGGFEAELIGRELTAKRNEIMQALASMQGMLTADQQLALQRELALLDNALRSQQMGYNNDQFAAQLGFNHADRSRYYDLLERGLIG